jgi:hypothetical protein
MLFPQLNKYREKDLELAKSLDALQLYLSEWLSKNLAVGDPLRFFNYKAFVTYSAVPKGLGLAILNLCEAEGILVSEFQFYCPDTENFILSTLTVESAPREIECEWHDRPAVHAREDCLVEILFGFNKEFISHLKEYSF